MAFLVRSNLRQLIVALALLSTLVAVVNMFVSSVKVQRQALIDNTFQSNEAYASKLAESTQFFLENTQLGLAHSAKKIAENWSNRDFLQQESLDLAEQNNTFSSVVLVNAQGIVLAGSANITAIIGTQLQTLGSEQSLNEKKPLVSKAYQSKLQNLVVMITSPIFAKDGTYLGYIGGTIYLKEKNVLSHLLGNHHYQDGSYIYVINQQKQLLYHPNEDRLGAYVTNSVITDLVLSGKTGHAYLITTDDIEMLSGYAYIPAADWGLVVQRPAQATLASLDGLMQKVILNSFPINIVMLAFIWGCAWLISHPLRQLASNAKNMRQRATIQRTERIRAWYFEADELKRAFLFGLQNIHDHVGQLNVDIRTDPLTGLSNRRTLDYLLKKFEESHTPFAAITLDIDHFKHVNDTYGHNVGDIVLKELALLMRKASREQDFCIRLGGEEFLIILPSCSVQIATEVAERLRLTVANYLFSVAGHITISLGVAVWPTHNKDTHQVLKLADEMLYAAKQGGRNQVQVATTIID